MQNLAQTMMYQPLTIGSLIDYAAQYHGDTDIVSVNTYGGIENVTWGSVALNSHRLADALRKLGVQKGDRCGTIAWNNRSHLEIYFGVAGAGMVCHTLNPRLSPENMIYIVNNAEDKVLFLDKTFLPFAQKLRDHFKSVTHYVYLGPRDEEVAAMVDGILFYEEFLDTGDETAPFPELEENMPSSLCYTSGTTGNPKGVLYTHRSTVLHSLGGNQPDGIAISAKDTVMPVVPMFHVNAWGVPYVAAMTGCKLVLPGPGLDGPSLVKLIESEKVTLALGVPTIWIGLLDALKKAGPKAAESLKRTVVGGSALPPSMIPIFRDEYGVELIHAWGMTETSPLGTMNQLLQKHLELDEAEQAKIRLGQGRPPYGVELRIVDEEGLLLPNNGKTSGNLQIRGHWIASRYFGHDESALTNDGWFDTGDVASLDGDGYLNIVDRSKDIIKSGGEWISTLELENIAIADPRISNAAAIAAKHPKWDERPVIVAVKAPDTDPSEEDILKLYKGKVADWQIPDRVVFVDELPIGSTGKVLKNKLRDEYGDILL